MTSDGISEFLLSNFSGLKVVDAWGEKSFFYNPDNLLKRGIYFCTLKEKDGANDKSSGLNRDNIFRVNFFLSKKTFLDIFTILPKRPSKGNVIEGGYDFKALDVLIPHPIYGWMVWVSILNPSSQSFEKLKKLFDESYQIACDKYLSKMAKHGYVPDGNGITYNYQQVEPGADTLVDDDLVLWFTKKHKESIRL